MYPEMIITELNNHISFVDSLHCYSHEALRAPMENSRWSVCDVVSHIMKWDGNFAQTALAQILHHEPAVLEEHVDVQAFNDHAVEYGRTLPVDELLDQAILLRRELVSLLRQVPAGDFLKTFSDRNSYTLAGFLEEMFVAHDAHHRKQIEGSQRGSSSQRSR